jgi:methylated-DNA-[protein]-cysteine S-methyltransferase
MTTPLYFTYLPSPLGQLLLTASANGLRGLWIMGEKHCPALPPQAEENPAAFTSAAAQLTEYFSGTRQHFELPLEPLGTPFQLEAWAALQKIPYGETRTYQQQAAAIQRPAAIRAIGTANGRNPLSIIVPCHRVIGANGTLTGYGGGLAAKQWLLDHERRHALSANRHPIQTTFAGVI